MKIYLISSNTNQYDDYNVVLGYKTTEAEAKAAVETLKESYNKAKKLKELLNNEYRRFNEENAAPKWCIDIEYPKWPSGIRQSDITQEMRDIRKRIEDKNQEERNKYSILYEEWQKKQIKSANRIIEPFLNEPWFDEWFDVGERFISCSAGGLVEGHEYIYEICEELK